MAQLLPSEVPLADKIVITIGADTLADKAADALKDRAKALRRDREPDQRG